MEFIYTETLSRRLLTAADNSVPQLDSKRMAQLGQDFQAAYDAIAANPEHTITVYVPEVIE